MDLQFRTEIILGMVLFICAIKDCMKRQISLYLACGAFIVLVVMKLFQSPALLPNMAGGVLIGVVLLVVSKLSGGQLGMGDGIIFIVTGVGLGFWINLCLLVYSLTLAGLFSIAWLFLVRKGKKQLFPFIPFVFLGYLGVVLL